MNIQTLRYHERRGLLAEPERSNGGHRLYGEEAVTGPASDQGRPATRIHPWRRSPNFWRSTATATAALSLDSRTGRRPSSPRSTQRSMT
ncbi:MerR family DNA-binding transcriptional regulator [Streptomyces longwoodensis]|uniref:MerR family DNA-binding transcriptional regulator n=1 Tax=Streptomyces longwoodensis TaxID=68231 RepID=UPI00340B8A95